MNALEYEIHLTADLVRQGRLPLVALLVAFRQQELWIYRCFEAWPHAFTGPHIQLELKI
jgi:hypothetical protein